MANISYSKFLFSLDARKVWIFSFAEEPPEIRNTSPNGEDPWVEFTTCPENHFYLMCFCELNNFLEGEKCNLDFLFQTYMYFILLFLIESGIMVSLKF